MIDLDGTDLIESLSTGTYTITRRVAGSYVNGIYVPGATSTFTIIAAIVPATGRDLLRLPEGRRSVETRILFTTSTMLVGAQAGTNDADLVTVDGDVWEVQQSEAWKAATGYCRAIIQRAGNVLP